MSQNGIVDGSDAEIRFGLLDLKRQLSACIESGRVDKSVLDLLVTSGGCAPIESELLDYKRDAPTEAVGLAKLAVHVVSFHNTFGGYLIFGVEEEQRDQRFSPRGIARGAINIQQLKTTIRNYTGKSVDITYQDVTISVGERELVLGLLFIPKRLVATAPIKFGKQSPKRDEKYIFQAGDVFYRVQDSNVRAESSEQWWFLASERLNPHAAAENPPVTLIGSRRKIVDENLPDRNVICPGFIGRSETILELWQWLSDDFQFAKVLAGDGGKGKTSIAYQFAEDICRSSPFDFEKVIWLTAKTKQFRGLNDDYDPVYAHFNTYTELLQALCEAMPILPAEIEGATPHLLKQILREAFATTHTFVVIDDVDSLPIEQQRLTFEAASDIGNNQSRFLLTTRRNLTYSSDKCIEVQGFNEQDYSEYVHVFLMRLKSPHLSDSDIEKLRDATDGSPLYTESLLRLVRNGMRLSDAIHTWKGVLGTKVRRAALEREVNQLSSESRRVLLAAVYLFECSYTELRQVTGYDDEQLNQYVDELRGLFLLGAPRITSNEARFAVQSNTRVLISNLAVAKKLAIDPDNIRHLCEKIRTGAPALKKRENKRAIAAAVTQANAFLREREWTSAQETLLVALKKNPGNADLRFALGKYWMAREPANFSDAKKCFKEAYDVGLRRHNLFSAWYDCEWATGDFVGAIDVAKSALKDDESDRVEWLIKRAGAYKALSAKRIRSRDISDAIDDLQSCNRDLRVAWPLSKSNHSEDIHSGLVAVGTQLRILAEQNAQGVPGWLRCFDVLQAIVTPENESPNVAQSMITCAERIFSARALKGTLSTKEQNLIRLLIAETTRYVKVKRRSAALVGFQATEERISMLDRKLSELSGALVGNYSANLSTLRSDVAGEFDVFLAHNSLDKAAARALATRLSTKGHVKAWLDEAEIPPGQPFQRVIQSALTTARAIAILIGPHGIGRWQALELRTAISKAVEEGRPVIPVLLPGAIDVGKELPFLMEFNSVQFQTLDDAEALDRLIWGISYAHSTTLGSE